ncbi:MAG TPA: undecaprenyl-phosphate glucose phosphotransferase, partial [Acidobacteriota bacterium]
FLMGAFLAKRHAGLAAGLFRLGAMDIYFLFFLLLAWNIAARGFGLYDELRARSFVNEVSALGENILLQVFLTVVILFAAKSRTLSRFFLLSYCVLLLASLLSWRVFLNVLFTRRRKNGRHLSQILIVGGGEVARRFFTAVTANAHLGFRVIGFVAEQPQPGFTGTHLGTIEQLSQVLEREKVDDVVIALPNSAMNKIGQVIAVCENFPVRVRIIPDYFKFMSPRFEISRFGSFPLISIRANPLEQLHWRSLKRGFDLVFTLLAFVLVFSWLWPLLALLIKATSPGPVFFKQERWGLKNKRIVCYKFRSMVKESRDVDENGRYLQAARDDSRITRLGRFLRHSNLDELPQFINVLKGDMSVIGPRPHPTPMNLEIKDSIQHYQMRHLIKPGITGWAQVNGFRGETGDPEMLRRRVEADIWYIENWSFLLDLKIICLSLWIMLKGDPFAY